MGNTILTIEEIQDLDVWAYDEKGKLTHVTAAERGKKYTSKCCRCPVHIVHRDPKVFYARNPNKPHADWCPRSDIIIKIIKDMNATNPDKLFKDWLKPRRRSSAPKKLSGQPSAAATHGRIQRISSQKEFYDLGLYSKACGCDKIGEHTAGEFILTFDRIPSVINENKSLGMLSIPVRKDGYNDELLALQFILLDGGPITRSKVFVMIFPEYRRERYYAYRHLLYFSEHSSQISEIYLMADWLNTDFEYCELICRKKCKNIADPSVIAKNHGEIPWRCTGMQTGLFVNDVQIFIPGISRPRHKKPIAREDNQVQA